MCIRDLDKLSLALVVWFRLNPISDNGRAIPKIVAHIKIVEVRNSPF